MLSSVRQGLGWLVKEPPLRLLTRAVIEIAPVSLREKALWDASPRPWYLTAVLAAAEEAARVGAAEISVAEFGVASGKGLLCLQDIAAAVEHYTGISISVYGFDTGKGLPPAIHDYREHPDIWQPGDFPMDESSLRAQLAERTTLVLGEIAETVPRFVESMQHAPIGFAAIDVDLYSSTRDALRILTLPGKRMLPRTALYFDDIQGFYCHKFAGELLAIDEFNATNNDVKIDRWYGLKGGRPFRERLWLNQMFQAHDLVALSKPVPDRGSHKL